MLSTKQNKNKIALITGAASGLGKSIARRLSLDNFNTVIVDLDKKKISCATSEIQNSIGYVCNIMDENSVKKLAKKVKKDFGDYPDVLINNAGIVRFGNILEHSLKDFKDVIDVNLIGTFLMSREFGKEMSNKGSGVIINITSLNAFSPSPDAGSYPASKAAVGKFTEQLALTLGPNGVRVNAIAPGFINDGMSKPIYLNPAIEKIRAETVPLGRIGSADDISSTVSFLVSDEASYIHGQHILVDGGISKSLKNHLKRKPPK